MPVQTTQSNGPKAQPWKNVVKSSEAIGNEYITLGGPVADREESGTLSGQKIDISAVTQREESGTLSG